MPNEPNTTPTSSSTLTELPKRRNPFTDSMQLGDRNIQVSIRCAQCNQPVQTGVTHVCPSITLDTTKENQNA